MLEERVLARYVPAYKTDEADTESVGDGGRWRSATQSAGERRLITRILWCDSCIALASIGIVCTLVVCFAEASA